MTREGMTTLQASDCSTVPLEEIHSPITNAQGFECDDMNSARQTSVNAKKLMRRVDSRVIPILCILYVFAFLDRVNIANARLFGLSEDLVLTGNQYNTALTIFFVPYIIFEIPSNILLKRFHPNVWLSGCMFLFGIVTMCQGLVHNYSSLLAARFFLGFCESGMFPGCFYLIGMWYERSEAQRRYSFFFSSTSLAGAFGGLLASGIGKMDGIRGFHGWRWIFIIEGLITVIVALVCYFFIPSFPAESSWLSKEEKSYLKNHLQTNQGSSAIDHKTTPSDIRRVLIDVKVILGGFMYLGMIVPAYGYAFFAPTIISTFDYKPIQAQLHSVAPWECAFVFCMLTAIVSDYAKHRFFFVISSISIAVAGLAIQLSAHDHMQLRYVGLFLIVMGTFSAMPIIVCWFTMNLTGHLRRAIGTAWQIGFGNIGGIIATYSFLSNDAPNFIKGYTICLGFLCLSGLSCAAYYAVISWENRRFCASQAAYSSSSIEHAKPSALGQKYLL